MGWGIYLYPEIYYSKVDFRSKSDVLQEIEDIKRVIEMLEEKLLSLIMTTEPQKMMSNDEECSPSEWLFFEYRNIMKGYDDSLKGYYYRLWKLELLYDNWDEALDLNNNIISPPEGVFKNRRAYMWGDYLESNPENVSNIK